MDETPGGDDPGDEESFREERSVDAGVGPQEVLELTPENPTANLERLTLMFEESREDVDMALVAPVSVANVNITEDNDSVSFRLKMLKDRC